MKSKVGRNVKLMSKILLVVEVVASIIYAVNEVSIIAFLISLPTAVITSYLVYGFGELIEKTAQIAENTKKDDAPEQEDADNFYGKIDKLADKLEKKNLDTAVKEEFLKQAQNKKDGENTTNE